MSARAASARAWVDWRSDYLRRVVCMCAQLVGFGSVLSLCEWWWWCVVWGGSGHGIDGALVEEALVEEALVEVDTVVHGGGEGALRMCCRYADMHERM